MDTPSLGEIILVEYRDSRLRRIWAVLEETRELKEYEFEWCRRDKCLYWEETASYAKGEPLPKAHELYCGGTIWLRGDIDATGIVGPRLESLPEDFSPEILFDPEAMTGCVYCPICDDNLPEDDFDRSCDHIYWCNSCPDYITPDDWDEVGGMPDCLNGDVEIDDSKIGWYQPDYYVDFDPPAFICPHCLYNYIHWLLFDQWSPTPTDDLAHADLRPVWAFL